MEVNTTIYLENIVRAPHLLSITYCYEAYRFEVAIWYDIDLEEIEKKYSISFMEYIYFHIAAFELNKLSSLKPTYIDFGKYDHFVTQDFWQLWQTIQQKVWAQWRYEHDLPFYQIKLVNPIAPATIKPKEIIKGEIEVLSFFGGGKDSLVATHLLEKQNIPYASFVYSHSIYGKAEKQHEIVKDLLATFSPQKVHKQYLFDSFMDSPILQIENQINIKSLTAAETPSSIFACLPILLAEGYQYIALGHEHSANTGNLIWEKTGEEVNHQWGKSYDAEKLLNTYIQLNLLQNFAYFSLLQPIHDVLIFNLLRQNLERIPFAHSCNVEKPWCKKCPKCAYVWLNYMAYLPIELVNPIFGNTNLLDIPENQLAFEQMLGFGKHTPFECIGQIEESRLALYLCYQKGLRGEAMKWYEYIKTDNIEQILQKFIHIYAENGLPQRYASTLYTYFEEIQDNTFKYFQNVINSSCEL